MKTTKEEMKAEQKGKILVKYFREQEDWPKAMNKSMAKCYWQKHPRKHGEDNCSYTLYYTFRVI